MRLEKLTGHGSSAAFVSAGALAVLLVIQQQVANAFSHAPSALAIATIAGYFVALWLWLGALNVMLLDLERRERLTANMRWLRIARVIAPLAIVTSVLLPIVVLTQTYWLYAGSYALMYLAVGAVLLVHNVEARRARLLQGLLPWLGMATGVAYLVVGLTDVARYVTPEVAFQVMFGLPFVIQIGTMLVLIEVNPQNLGELLYIVWAIWLGVKLSGASVVAPVAARSV